MKCQNCGANISKTARFCSKCGAEVAVPEVEKKETQIVRNSVPAEVDKQANPAPILAGIGGAFLIGLLIFFVVGQSPNTDQTATGNCINPIDQTAMACPIISTLYTTATAKVHSCGSVSCSIVGTYPQGTSIDVSSYEATDTSMLPNWVAFSYTNTDGSPATGYIKKSVLSDAQPSSADTGQTSDNQTLATQNSTSATTQSSSQPTSAQQQTESQAQNSSSINSAPSSVSLPEIVSEWRKRTAYIECDWDYNNDPNQTSYYADGGSGMLADYSSTGFTILTNAHVVDNATYGGATQCFIKFPDDNGFYGPVQNPNITVATDGNDWGELRNLAASPAYGSVSMTLNQRANPYPTICGSPENIGDSITVIGYPDYGSTISAVGPIEVTVTQGIISGRDRGYYTTSAQIEHGNSGGIAVDLIKDCYIGIPSAFVSGQAGSLGRILPESAIFQ